MQPVNGLSHSEEPLAFRYHRLRSLRLALLVLSFSWLTAPMVAMGVSLVPLVEGPTGLYAYPAFAIVLSAAMLGKSSRRIGEKVKIMAIPLAFLSSYFVALLLRNPAWVDALTLLGTVGIFVCPLWISEVVRQRAHEYKQEKYNLCFLVLNHLAVVWILLAIAFPFLAQGHWLVLSTTLYLLYVYGFLGLRKRLSEPLRTLEEELLSSGG